MTAPTDVHGERDNGKPSTLLEAFQSIQHADSDAWGAHGTGIVDRSLVTTETNAEQRRDKAR